MGAGRSARNGAQERKVARALSADLSTSLCELAKGQGNLEALFEIRTALVAPLVHGAWGMCSPCHTASDAWRQAGTLHTRRATP